MSLLSSILGGPPIEASASGRPGSNGKGAAPGVSQETTYKPHAHAPCPYMTGKSQEDEGYVDLDTGVRAASSSGVSRGSEEGQYASEEPAFPKGQSWWSRLRASPMVAFAMRLQVRLAVPRPGGP